MIEDDVNSESRSADRRTEASNPFRAGTEPGAVSPTEAFWVRVAAKMLYFYPLLPVSLIYVSWGLACAELGRAPIPYREYPRNPAIFLTANSGAILLIACPVCLPVGWAISWGLPFGAIGAKRASYRDRAVSMLCFMGMCWACWWLVHEDPWRVIDWFFD